MTFGFIIIAALQYFCAWANIDNFGVSLFFSFCGACWLYAAAQCINCAADEIEP